MPVWLYLAVLLFASSVAPAIAQAPSPEMLFWQSVSASTNPAEIQAYLDKFPDGLYADLARIRLQKLEQPLGAEATSPQATAGAADSALKAEKMSIKVRLGPNIKGGAWLGIQLLPVSEEITGAFAVAKGRGAFIREILSERAMIAGLHVGDVVTAIDGRGIEKPHELLDRLKTIPAEQTVELEIWRAAPTPEDLLARLEAAAKAGNASAMTMLGQFLNNGNAGTRDVLKARDWLRRAAEHGDATGMALSAAYHAQAGNEVEAISWLQRAAEKGQPSALFDLGQRYAQGRGVAKDEARAAALLRKAAEAGDTNATYLLASLYSEGRGVPKDAAKALTLYDRAAKAGSTAAMFKLAFMYEQGQTTDKNPSEAASWYQKAAKGSASALHNLARLHIDGAGVERDLKKAARLIYDAIRRGSDFTVRQMTTNANAWSKPFRIELQTVLRHEGAYTGAIDGAFGAGTRNAITELAKRSNAARKAALAMVTEQRSLSRGKRRPMMVTMPEVNVFDLPTVEFGRIGVLHKGDRILVGDHKRVGANGKWAWMCFIGLCGWVDAEFLEEAQPLAVALPAQAVPAPSPSQIPSLAPTSPATAAGSPTAGLATNAAPTSDEKAADCGDRPCLRARGGPSDPPVAIYERSRAWADVVGKIPAGAGGIVALGGTAMSASVEWLHVEYNGIRGWVPGEFLKADAADQPAMAAPQTTPPPAAPTAAAAPSPTGETPSGAADAVVAGEPEETNAAPAGPAPNDLGDLEGLGTLD